MKETPLNQIPSPILEQAIAQLESQNGTVEDITNILASAVGKVVDVEARITLLKEQYEALSARDQSGYTWEQVTAAIPNLNEFLEGVDSLSEPEIYWVNEEGQLVVGDGCAERPEETKNLDYNHSRTAATRVANRGLITLEEYRRKNRGQFEVQTGIWVEGGENPSDAWHACWGNGNVDSYQTYPDYRCDPLGSRRVIRTKLNFQR